MFLAVLMGATLAAYCSIDLGTKNLKVGFIDINGDPRVAPNSKNLMMTPAAIAIKFMNHPFPANKHLSIDQALSVQVKVGDDALSVLKNRPEAGSSFVPRLIGRENVSDKYYAKWGHSRYLNPSEMLALIIKHTLHTSSISSVDGCVVAIPAYYTFAQRKDISDAMWAAQINFFGLIDDDQAVPTLYSIRFAKRFSKRKQSILFVDAGFNSVKAYRCVFQTNHSTSPPTPNANVTSYEWSECVGSSKFIEKIASYKNISMKKAEKYLFSSNDEFISKYYDVFKDEILLLQQLIKRAINGPIDEVQIFGGASRLEFISDIIKNVLKSHQMDINDDYFLGNDPEDDIGSDIFNDLKDYIYKEIPVKKELSINDAVSFGALYVLQDMQNLSMYTYPNLTRCSPYNSYVECGGVISEYCYQSSNCSEGAVLENSICEKINIYTDPENAPEGCSNLLGQQIMVNSSDFTHHPSGGFLMFKPPAPMVNFAMWCRNSDFYCDYVALRQSGSNELQKSMQLNFVDTIFNNQKQIEKINYIRADIMTLLESIESIMESDSNGEKIEGKIKDMKEKILSTIENSKSVYRKTQNIEKLRSIYDELQLIAVYLDISPNSY